MDLGKHRERHRQVVTEIEPAVEIECARRSDQSL
jgi:hypothetical protein